MNSTKTSHAVEPHHTRANDTYHHVPAWPRLKAVVNPDGTGTLTVNGTHHPCEADSVDSLRIGMTARAVSYARTLRRPVRMDVADGPDHYRLAIRPEGYVQLLSDTGTIKLHEDLIVSEGPCRRCGHPQPVTSDTCSACHVREPFNVEAPTAAERETSPERETVTKAEAPPAAVRVSTPVAHELLAPEVNRLTATAPTAALLLAFDAQHSARVPGRVVIGRNPDPIDGRHPVRAASPRRELSRTHATIDVDDCHHIRVTDLGTPNGVKILSSPPRRLIAGAPTLIDSGTQLLLGDVECTITLVRNDPS